MATNETERGHKMANVTATQQMILDAIANYANGSSGLVRAFEAVATRYYNEDSHGCENLTFFANSLSAFPKMQAALVRLIKDTKKSSALFAVKVTLSDEGKYIIANMKGDKAKELKAQCQQNLAAFIGKQYSSLMNIDKVETAPKAPTFDRDATIKALRSGIERQIANMLTVNAEMDITSLRGMIEVAMAGALDAGNIAKIRTKLEEKAKA